MSKGDNSLLSFLIGVVLLGAGLFLFCQQVTVSSNWYSWGFLSFAGRNFSNGLVTVPLIIGIIMFFFNPKSMVAKIIIALGAVFILATVIMSIQFRFQQTTLYVYILMIGMIAAGAGILLRVMFKNKQD